MNKAYTSYVPINQKWAKQIPSHWDARRMKAVFAMRKERNNPIVTENILSLTAKQGVVPYAEKEGTGGNKPKSDLTQYNVCHENDLLVNCMNVVSGAAGVSRYYGAISPVYYAFYPHKDENIWYYHYIFRLLPFQRSLVGLGKGILMHESEDGTLTSVRMRISMDYLGNVLLPVPPREEQDQIVQFLDWKVSGINKLIAVKQKQIATLKEFMQAEIEEQLYAYPVVSVVRLKQLGTFFKGGGFSRDNLVEDEDYPAILYGDIYTQYEYKTSIITHHIDGNAYSTSRKISKGDIVMAGTGETKDEIGKSILYMGEQIVAVGGDVIVFHPNEGTNVEYLLYQLYSQASLKHRYINGKGDIIVHIYPTALGNTIITLPGEAEQNKAVARINKIIDQVNKAITVLTDEISVLREYRVRLVADTVTGKIDVRGIEIPEYEFVDEDNDNVDENLEQGADEPPEEE